jgi:hypothetical protein
MVDEREEFGGESGEMGSKVAEVAGIEGKGFELVDDGEEIVERGDGAQGLGVGRPQGAAGGGDEQRRGDEERGTWRS